MKSESSNIEDYLQCTQVINCHSVDIQIKAKEIIGDEQDEAEKARLIYEWVRDVIPHSNDINAQKVSCTASEVLLYKTGMCFSKSHLLAALLRAVQIPVGFCYQVLRNDPPVDNTLVLHGLNGIYLSKFKKWVIVDARGNSGEINAQFDIEEPRLAFSQDSSAGEYLYETVFVSPFEHVVDRLRKYDNREDFGNDLPKPITVF